LALRMVSGHLAVPGMHMAVHAFLILTLDSFICVLASEFFAAPAWVLYSLHFYIYNSVKFLAIHLYPLFQPISPFKIGVLSHVI
jgi:hypothetical protein